MIKDVYKLRFLMDKNAFSQLIVSVFFTLVLCLVMSTNLSAASLLEQRSDYRAAITADDKKRYRDFKRLKYGLKDYPLYPYLAYREFMRELPSATLTRVKRFEERYADMPFTTTLRSRYLGLLGIRKDWSTFLAYQPEPPNSEQLQCYYYRAKAQRGARDEAIEGAKSLFLKGKSVKKACDPLFLYLKRSGEMTDALILERLLLAFDSRNLRLMKYLAKQPSQSGKASAAAAIRLYGRPDNVEHFSRASKVTAFNGELVMSAVKKLARANVKEAVRQFNGAMKGQKIADDKRQETAEFIAGRLMSTTDAALMVWRDNIIQNSSNVALIDRRFRLALTRSSMNAAGRWIDQLPEEEANKLKWRYWQARVARDRGHHFSANQRFEDMTGERNFYSIAAAVQLGQSPYLPFANPIAEPQSLEVFKKPLERVRELLALDKVVAAKREWEFLLRRSSREQIEQLAVYASDKKWHHLAVQATIRGKLWNLIQHRFPIAHRGWFDMFSKKRQLPLTTLLALCRQESAFYSQAVSPVGARGLMQLMPATARATSKKLGIRYRGKSSLTDPVTNIRIGSGYLRELLDKYDDNRVLALAAYNAGPSRVKRWLNDSNGNLDAVAFIETIPFKETRGYVQNVLVFEMYYRELLGKPQLFLQPHERNMRY
ncbi:lytic transglycosylase [Veronia pacifica]|uniref:Lytic transglycosylase n=3 Tax=Veronia pacifica TaxID=1080227 RepID=A0A1C3EK89_9GAMM|nr:lytic transglycosylase [Veronia pacifica]